VRHRLAVLLLAVALPAWGAEIRGRITNAVGGEPLERVEIVVLENKARVVSSTNGEFDIPNLAPGSYTLWLNAVGYRLLTVRFTLSTADEAKEFSITMVPDNFYHTDKVEVHADVFQVADSPATMETNLTASEIRETSTVFADDPFRAVQTLPGVSAEGNNEFFAEFSVMGAPFSSVSIYIDDVLVEDPFHEIGNFSEGASLGVLTSEVVDEMKLLPAAYPERYGDADGAALDIHTREGSHSRPLFRVSAGIVASEILGEGAVGPERNGSWLFSARKSYINYLIKNRVQDAADVGFEDADLKLNYDLSPRQQVSLFATDGHTNMAMTDPASLSDFDYASGVSDFSFARAGWRWTLSPKLLIDARGAYIREPDQLFNNTNLLLTKTDHREWVGSGAVSWAWKKEQLLQAGLSERSLRDSEEQTYFVDGMNPESYSLAGSGLHQSAYIQQSANFPHQRVSLLASLRWDRFQTYLPQRFSPQIEMALHATRSTQFQVAGGRYTQYFNAAYSLPPGNCVGAAALPPTSEHYTAAVEQRLGDNTRLRLQAFQRKDSYTLGEAFSSGPIISSGLGDLISSNSCPVLTAVPGGTFQRDYSHGVQLVLQRRSANRLSGWLGYTLMKAQERLYQVPVPYAPYSIFYNSGGYFPTVEDQRHTVNAFATYRLKPTLNLSGKFVYGSGVPVPSGAYIELGNGQYLPFGLNQTRLGTYARLDVRSDKDWAFDRWKLTLYGEILNLTNHYNARYAYESGIDPATGQAQVKTLEGLPVTPTVGVVFQF
jgi:CarboxypepD_reg-like domain